ncbi:response regulator transcription factor [Shewanella maritima]|uniref:Response regulator transcription factor n=1 Tax=Shewanella maritima TaxID=2520507 RepID=A0A411PIY9_9GAMM|nr:response regulator [Shewanella maritima]QBF83561.1 response regulator transcription factor [Shewanella maritima]
MNNQAVYLVDDDEAILDSISFLMEGFDYQLTCFSSGEQFLEQIDLAQVGCVILDARMPGFSGPEVHKRLTQAQSPLAVIFLTAHGDVPMAVEALKSGAFEFFQKPVDGQALASAITKGLTYSQQQYDQLAQKALIEGLSKREKQIFSLIVAGKTNKEMANELCVAVRTIEVHRAKLMLKLNVSNLAELMQLSKLA